ncbi:aminotransferase class I/II-fold pyridoxal phosphate-dependent enzyme [Paracidobacterium acidisoli]|uniref:Aminotransferase class I/II-fold pyridoxal phosphate-dependent enzyme n=1 Tax=Paracidobacterium acidisoli TaxID=2303751 RepID=A0A372IP75_9BACT|nr:aminotransferase class I/II-fold pyridoxal phosphate-dependent enzyme [Paracidobacterium acidisoli]MBT9331067.1 aminotransferase class I/II-fold pyridoxal phosphate-dependent enzyme [Paracidobacterium acidisoli]
MTTEVAQAGVAESGVAAETIRAGYEAFKARGLKLNLTRGKPAPAQLDLSAELLALPGAADYMAEGVTDIRNYGGLQGLAEARRLFAGLMGAPAEQVIVANNASLALMHDTVVYALLKGTCDSEKPWSQQGEIAFLCPVPGYDRHFRICEDYGIRMIPVAMNADGPDMDEVERLAAGDASIRGIWCVPKYSNPTGAVYSDAVVERLAGMKTAAADFRIYWDNAYAVHHLTEEKVEIANILEACARQGHANRAYVFASTSKITLAGSGLALFASSKDNVKWLTARMTPRTIGPDKVNQLRHVRFLKDEAGITALMERQRALIAPKFEKVLEIFDEKLSDVAGVSWTRPKGGYFISLDVPPGCAKRVIELAKAAGVELTPAGATHPLGKDPEDRTIRIAPSFPELEEVALAAEGVAVCVKLTVEEKGQQRVSG